MKLLTALFLLLGAVTQTASTQSSNYRIIVSTSERWLWLMRGNEVVLHTPVAVGMSKNFCYLGKCWYFQTPRGNRVIDRKATDPIWIPPPWFFFEVAASYGIPVVDLSPGKPVKLSDGTRLFIQGDTVYRSNDYGAIWAWSMDKVILIDGKVFMPPVKSEQRKVEDALGPYALYMGDGYMIHGTHEGTTDSIGLPVSHGCVRIPNNVLAELYRLVPIGTRVEIR